ncbi:nucleoid-associated protein [Klebsiella variicola subsp. variicola]|nr:nucleoid-associated protein [Klebsiella variicola subsp. variicola]
MKRVRLAQALRLQRQGKKSFWRSAARRLVVCAMNWRNIRSLKGGIVLFCQYRYLAVEYLLVAVLNNLSSMRVNEELDIRSTHYWILTMLISSRASI